MKKILLLIFVFYHLTFVDLQAQNCSCPSYCQIQTKPAGANVTCYAYAKTLLMGGGNVYSGTIFDWSMATNSQNQSTLSDDSRFLKVSSTYGDAYQFDNCAHAGVKLRGCT